MYFWVNNGKKNLGHNTNGQRVYQHAHVTEGKHSGKSRIIRSDFNNKYCNREGNLSAEQDVEKKHSCTL